MAKMLLFDEPDPFDEHARHWRKHKCVYRSELGAQAGSLGLLRCECGKLQMYLVPPRMVYIGPQL